MMNQKIKKYCLSQDLATYDPYDIWKTGIGIRIKNLYNSNKKLGAVPALALTLYDLLLNNSLRIGYKKQEYPIVRGLAAQILLNEFGKSKNDEILLAVRRNLNWLKENSSKGYSGACWGLGFTWSAFRNMIYDSNTPHVTHTPYPLEAFHRYTTETGDTQYSGLIKSSFLFFEKDLHILYEDDEMMAVSYGPHPDKIVTNATSYALYSYSIFLNYFPEKKDYILNKIRKFFRFLEKNQHHDGSWFYSHPEQESFIDCFHSCIVIKNLMKTNKNIHIDGLEKVAEKGFKYVNDNFFIERYGLYKRFTHNNKISLIRFDLYDNAEVLNLANMMGDKNKVLELSQSIEKHFVNGENIYSGIDYTGIRRNKNMLRWAVMPYLFSLSAIKN